MEDLKPVFSRSSDFIYLFLTVIFTYIKWGYLNSILIVRIKQCHWATRVLGILKFYISLLPCITLHIYINICSEYLHNLLYNESSQSSTVTWNVEKTIKSMQYVSFYFNDITQRFKQRERERRAAPKQKRPTKLHNSY